MKENIDAVLAMFANDSTPCGRSFSTVEEQETPATQLQVYPNPAKDHLYLQWAPAPDKAVPFTIYDITGRVVQIGSTSGNLINVASLNSGFYLLQIRNQGSYTKKFIKH